MSKWQQIKLGELCSKIGSGATPKGGATVYVENGTSLIRSQNVYNLRFEYSGLTFITDDAAKKLSGVTIQPNDVLINITGDSVARTCIVPANVIPARVNQHVAILRTKQDVLNPKYLNYFLASPQMQAHMLGLAVGKGASRNAMTKGMIENFTIPLPPIEVQRKIADVLSAYDDLIENNRKQIKLLEEAAQRLYKEWFIDIRFPGHENTKIINGIPDGWRIEKAMDFFNITIGKTPPRSESQCFTDGNNGIPWVSISDMGSSGAYIFFTAEGLTADSINKYNVKKVPIGTILLSFKLTLGRVSIVTTPCCTNEAIAHFHIDEEWIREYTYLYLKNFEYDTLGNTSSISKAVNSSIIKAMPFVLPNTDLISAFSKLTAPIFKKIYDTQKCINAAQIARDNLLPKLMNGELEVNR